MELPTSIDNRMDILANSSGLQYRIHQNDVENSRQEECTRAWLAYERGQHVSALKFNINIPYPYSIFALNLQDAPSRCLAAGSLSVEKHPDRVGI
jgi:hypothetical protein